MMRHPTCALAGLRGARSSTTLIDEAWCRFLAEERFYVGLSIDGPRELQDRYRVTKSQKATHKQVMQAFRLLRSEDTKAAAQAGRNDPCPCGSGKKYKKCCLAN